MLDATNVFQQSQMYALSGMLVDLEEYLETWRGVIRQAGNSAEPTAGLTPQVIKTTTMVTTGYATDTAQDMLIAVLYHIITFQIRPISVHQDLLLLKIKMDELDEYQTRHMSAMLEDINVIKRRIKQADTVGGLRAEQRGNQGNDRRSR